MHSLFPYSHYNDGTSIWCKKSGVNFFYIQHVTEKAYIQEGGDCTTASTTGFHSMPLYTKASFTKYFLWNQLRNRITSVNYFIQNITPLHQWELIFHHVFGCNESCMYRRIHSPLLKGLSLLCYIFYICLIRDPFFLHIYVKYYEPIWRVLADTLNTNVYVTFFSETHDFLTKLQHYDMNNESIK